jgi:hypothetical protein
VEWDQITMGTLHARPLSEREVRCSTNAVRRALVAS